MYIISRSANYVRCPIHCHSDLARGFRSFHKFNSALTLSNVWKTLRCVYAFFSASLVRAHVIVGFAVSPLSKTVKCTLASDALNLTYITVSASFTFFFCTAHVIIYALVLSSFWYKRKKIQNGTIEHSNFMKHQAALMPVVSMLMLFYAIFDILSEIFINISVNIDLWISSILSAFGKNLKACGVFVDFISLTMSCRKFRTCLKHIFCKKHNAVSQNR